ncbi:MAG: hypothetical protein KAQ92_01725, partial [Candidatus Aenigmarchaeota archaeon]|nr:hypothetical protein [Candidatus Aenigmarchaeota archaeon]
PSSNAYDEWIEIYNPTNLTLNLSDWTINNSKYSYDITCNNIQNCSLTTNSTYFILIWKKANISAIQNSSIKYFTSSDKGNYWLTNTGENLTLYNSSYSTNFSYNYSEKGNSFARFTDGSTNFTLCSTPTPGKKNNCSLPAENESKTYPELNLQISLNKKSFNIGDEITVIGNITNPFNSTINGTLSIKFKRVDMDEYPQDWIIIEQNINALVNVTNLSNIIGNLIWNIPEDAFAGEYKCYARFNLDESSKNKTGKSYITSSAFFDYAGIGNIFINSWNHSDLNLRINDTLNTIIIITNNESKPYNISAYLIIEKLKTATNGDSDEILYCNRAEILNNSSNIINCNWTVPHDSITQTSKIYPKIIFSIGEELIEKSGEEEKINISGLEDLGEPTFAIKTTQ